MPTSTERQGGFTLLEIMATVGLLGLILPMLLIREQAENRAYRSQHAMRALGHAQEILADHMREDFERLMEDEGYVEEDPAFRYAIVLEDWDLSTGGAERDEDEDGDLFTDDPSLLPGDAGSGEEPDPDSAEALRGDPHKVRRYEITVYWPALEDEEDDSLVLEGFCPRFFFEDDGYGAASRGR